MSLSAPSSPAPSNSAAPAARVFGGAIGRRLFLRNAATAVAGAFALPAAFPAIIPARVLGAEAPSNLLQIGQIGCGRIARDHDLGETLGLTKLARVVAVCDLDRNRLADGKRLVEGRYKKLKVAGVNVATFGDYRAMLRDAKLDAVMISTPDHWHAEPAIVAALAGKHVYLQKPTSLTVVEGRQLVTAVKRGGVVLQIGTQQRSMAQFRVAAEFVRNGRIGALKTVRIGLPGDPAHKDPQPKPTESPAALNYDAWLGSTPVIPYIEEKVHPQRGYGRPGWLRVEQFGAGMITGWGQHHFDSAAWGMDTELTGPVWVEVDQVNFPDHGIWDVHGNFHAQAGYANGVVMHTSHAYKNGIRYEGENGKWIFVSRGGYTASASDPVTGEMKNQSGLQASDPALLRPLGKDEKVRLKKSSNHHRDWLESIRKREKPLCPAEEGQRSCTICLITHIAMKLRRRLEWDPATERFKNDSEANALLRREQRKPYGTDAAIAA
ncbi:MAG: Gfo/Idh/MocA family oxidoreductase [Puniceicoccales bacterium]|jgi:predicted dehydrogenase|nr:Gfo/Idh/MocA family oxidoreductase [Puniceicoccales bacterium]